MTRTPLLETRRLTKHFGGVPAIDDVSLSVPVGGVLGVIGPNGAGKSTLINLVTGQVRPSGGRVFVHGRDVTGQKPWTLVAGGVARTFQIARPFRRLSVRENVAISVLHAPGKRGSRRAALAEADEVLERVGLHVSPETTPAELSVAQVRRLELAKALALRPCLLLLDEVLAGLRVSEIDPSLDLIHQLKQEGMTIVAVEHIMKAILAVSDEVLVLHQGRVLVQGSPREVLSDARVIEAYLGERFARRVFP